MKIIGKTLFILGAALSLLFSCATTEKEDFSSWRMTSFSVFDGSDNLIQSLEIIYNSDNKPAEIMTSGPSGEEISRKNMTYSETGKMILLENRSGGDSVIRSEYTYDLNDHLITVVTSNDAGDVLATASYINDERGNPVEWTSKYGRGNQPVHFLAEYDSQDRIIKTTELDAGEEVVYYSISEYDDKGNETSYTIYSPEGSVDQKLENHFLEGALIQSDIIDGDGNLLYSTVFELNDDKLPLLISNFNQYGDKSDSVEFAYNEDGQEIEILSYGYDGELREKTVKEYDDAGNNTAVIIYNARGEILSLTKSAFENSPLHMKEEEFNSLVFKLR